MYTRFVIWFLTGFFLALAFSMNAARSQTTCDYSIYDHINHQFRTAERRKENAAVYRWQAKDKSEVIYTILAHEPGRVFIAFFDTNGCAWRTPVLGWDFFMVTDLNDTIRKNIANAERLEPQKGA